MKIRKTALAATMVVLALALSAESSAQITEADAEELSGAIADLGELGLHTELASFPLAASPAPSVGAESGSAQTLDRMFDSFVSLFQRRAEQFATDVIEGIREACVVNLTYDGEGFELASVSVSLGGIVTATFTPDEEFCARVGG